MAEKPQRETTGSNASVESNKQVPGTENPTPPAQMTAPAHEGAKMVAPGRKVKIKAIRDINIGTAKEMNILKEGQTAEVTEEQAVEFCDKGFRGLYPYSGERYEDKQTSVIHRAVRV